jgi:hypothetical protein
VGAEQTKDLFTRRWRQVKRPEPSELQLQISLIEHLKYRARPGVVYFHVPNGEERDKRVAAKLKAMGVLPGVSDLVFVWLDDSGHLHNLYLELKARKRTMSPEQLVFCDRVTDAGAQYAYVDNIDDALRLLRAHGLLR